MGRTAVRKTNVIIKDTGKTGFAGKNMGDKAGKRAKVRSRGIMQTLLAAFLVPAAFMVILGIVSYNTAASGILSKYNESAVSTVSAMGDYCNLICDSISAKALEVSTNNTLIDYYKHAKLGNQDYTVMEELRDTRTIVSNAKSINKYMYSCSVIPEYGSYATTLKGALTEDAHADFSATAEGRFFVDNPTVRNQWMGYHTYLDEHLDSSPDRYAFAFYQKVLQSNTVVVADIDRKVIDGMLSGMDFGDGSIRALVSGDGREIVSIQGEEDRIPEEVCFVGNSFFEETRTAEKADSQEIVYNGRDYVYIYAPVGNTGIMICVLIPKSNLLNQVGSIKGVTIFMVILAVGAALAIGGIISAGISKTVKSMTLGLSAVAAGDLTKSFSTSRKDEFKILVTALNSTVDSMRLLMRDMKLFGAKVNELSKSVSDKTSAVNFSMQDIAGTMDDVAQGVQNQARDTENGNARMEDFAEHINVVSASTQGMVRTADGAIDAVEQGTVIVQDLSKKSAATVALTEVLVNDIDDVFKSTEEIKHIVDVISSIAEQTNLLSLNASIEAARAGETGRGFAVVAQDIRKLADQSKESGSKIRGVVENIGATTQKTAVSVKKAESMVNDQAQALAATVKVFDKIRISVGELVDEIRGVMEHLEQAVQEEETVQSAMQSISAVSEQVADSTAKVTATLGEQVSVVERLKEEAEILREDAEELGSSIDKFII